MNLDEFYACFPQWEREFRRCQRAHKALEETFFQQAPSPTETLYFLGHWDLLLLLLELVRLRRFLGLVFPPEEEQQPQHCERIAHQMRQAGHAEVTAPMVAAFFHAWQQETVRRTRPPINPDTCFRRTPQDQARREENGEEG